MTAVLEPLTSQVISPVDFQVVTCFVEFAGKILVLQRGRKDDQFGLWGIPGGKIDEGEGPRPALSREIFEETGIISNQDSFYFLDRALSKNKCDGTYVLYLYYVRLNTKPAVLINNKEHLNYEWVTLEEFENFNLLISQGLAYEFVKDKVKKMMEQKQ